ncbi:MAG: c-type cytochrome domain-containing protein [Phycisphaerales bacterium JB040]
MTPSLATVLGVAVTPGAGGTDWAEFVGRFHPLVVHLPIGLLGGVLLVEGMSLLVRRPVPAFVRRALYGFTALGAAGSAGVGWLLAEGGGYASDPLFWHRWLGVALGVVLLVTTIVAWPELEQADEDTRRDGNTKTGRWLGLALAALLTGVTGHLGGTLTHGEGYLTAYAPSWMGFGSREAPVLVSGDSGPGGDAGVLLSMLGGSCVECHGASKQKGNLRLDTPEGIASVVVAGDPSRSELFRRISLPAGHPDAMPPDGAPVGEVEVLAVMRWVREGARLEGVAAEIEAASVAEAADAALLEVVREETGAVVTEIPGEGGVSLLRVDYSLGSGAVEDERLLALGRAGSRVVELSLAGRTFDASALLDLGSLASLERLYLERSSVDDEALGAIVRNCPSLVYLNLHSTGVTDRALSDIAVLAGLERLVLFGTRVTGEGLRGFREARPGVEVSAGLGLEEDPFSARGPRRILVADASVGRIALLREVSIGRPDTLWEHPVEDLHDLHVLENGNVLFQTSWTELVEVDPGTGETVWRYDAATQNRATPGERVEVHAFQRLPGGVTMIAESGPARVIEVDSGGALLSVTPLTVSNPDPHHDTRLARKTDAGTYLVAHERDGVVREYTPDGTVVWSFDVPVHTPAEGEPESPVGHGDAVFSAVRLENGNTLIGTGNGHSVLEVSPGGEIVWGVSRLELEGIDLAWVTTVQRLANGNTVIGNCHAGEGQAQMIEVTPGKEVVWRFHDFERFGNSVANSFVLEDPENSWPEGDPAHGE